MTRSKATEAIVSALMVLLIGMLLIVAAGRADASTNHDPAAALPDDTMIYLELDRPAQQIDVVAGMTAWTSLSELLGVASEVLAEHGSQAAGFLDRLARWPDDPSLGYELDAVASQRLVVAVVPGTNPRRPLIVLAAEASGGGRQLETLERWLAATGRTLSTDRAPDGSVRFRIVDPSGATAASGVQRGWWLAVVLGQDPSLAGDIVDGNLRSGSLADHEPFRRLMSELPSEAAFRGYLDTHRLADQIEDCDVTDSPAERLARDLLRTTDGIGFGRRLTPDRIDTWLVGRVATDDGDLPRLMSSLRSLAGASSMAAIDGALISYELGVNPEGMAAALDPILAQVAPRLHGFINRMVAEFTDATGLDPRTQLLAKIDGPLRWVLLPAEGPVGWPLPRPVMILTTHDPEGVRDFLDRWFEWEAGAIAPLTGGWIGGRLVRRRDGDLELTGLELEGLLELPMPSPTSAVLEHTVLLSPVRSAVLEIAPLVESGRLWLGDGAPGFAPQPEEIVERFHVDFEALSGEFERIEALLPPDGAHRVDLARDTIRSIAALLAGLDHARGFTIVGDDGAFRSTLEIVPR
jgi:hypothetical protein